MGIQDIKKIELQPDINSAIELFTEIEREYDPNATIPTFGARDLKQVKWLYDYIIKNGIKNENTDILKKAVDCCVKITIPIKQSTAEVVRGCGVLAFYHDIDTYKALWQSLYDDSSAQKVLSSFGCLLHAGTSDWLKPPLLQVMARLPMKTCGVQATIMHIQRNSSKDMALEISKLLASVPTSVKSGEYYSSIQPQLEELACCGNETFELIAKATLGIILKRQ